MRPGLANTILGIYTLIVYIVRRGPGSNSSWNKLCKFKDNRVGCGAKP